MENVKLDKMGGNLELGTEGVVEMKRLKEDFYLMDGFRGKYRRKVEFSFRMGPIHVRLDRFYLSKELIQWVDYIKHTPCTVSDHYYVNLVFKDIDFNYNK